MKKILEAFENKDVGSIHSLVLSHRINPNTLIPSKGVSPLHLIIGHQSEGFAFKVTKLFLRCGGDPNVQSSDGVTPTHVAAAWGRNRILHLLLVNGGDPWMQDDERKNAFNYAFEEREWNTIEMLHHFQQMHSASNCKMDVDPSPKWEMNLERVLLRKGEEMFAYTPTKKITKSMMTQTESDLSDTSSSPIQDKIRYFEPGFKSPNLTAAGDTKSLCGSEKGHIGWVKDFYQASCEVVVHCDPSKKVDEENKETFISSIQIDTTPQSLESLPPPVKIPNNHSAMDVRGQLFIELQEAVRRRSKQMMPENKQVADNPDNSLKSNFSLTHNETLEKDSFMAKEVSYLYGVNLEDSRILKNMSDFATKVMREIEVNQEQQPGPNETVDLCNSSPEITNQYLSCEEESFPRNGQTLLKPQNNSETSNLYLTPYDSNTSNEFAVQDKSKGENSNESFVSVAEEYKYTDAEEGVVLIEKKRLLTPTISTHKRRKRPTNPPVPPSLFAQERKVSPSFAAENEEEGEKAGGEEVSTVSSTASTLPSSISYDSDILRCELKGLGYDPGPVTKTTKKLYLKKLWRLKKKAERKETEGKENISLVLSPSLEKTTTDPQRFEEISNYRKLEEEMCQSFENWTKRKWREGTNKTSFNYLLLDPRLSSNLPKRAPGMSAREVWKSFLSSVFYVGKGKRCRPYAHLYQATGFWEKRSAVSPDEKTERILEIWKEGLGVVCLQVFQNIIPVEAFTREAAMIDAMGLASLKNAKTGEYYGVTSTWPTRHKVKLGIYLLHKAMLIFLSEGERQIKPYDID